METNTKKLEKPKREPSLRMKKTVEFLPKNNWKIPDAMRDAGYPEATIHNSHKITKSKSFQYLLNEAFPYEAIREKYFNLVESKDEKIQLAALNKVVDLLNLTPDKKIKLDVYSDRESVFGNPTKPLDESILEIEGQKQ